MLSELVALRKRVAELEKGEARVAYAEKEKAQAERDVTYWKEEVKKALHWQVEWQHERKRREELKVVFDSTYLELKQARKLVTHLKGEGVANDKSRKALHDKVRIMTAEVDMYKRQREFEQGLRMKIEARFEELNARFNSERAERLQNMHRMNKEQLRVVESEKREREANLKTLETADAASELARLIRTLEAQVSSQQQVLSSQHRELATQASEIEALQHDSLRLRQVIAQKAEEVMSVTYRYLELEKELWRLQADALGYAQAMVLTAPPTASTCSTETEPLTITTAPHTSSTSSSNKAFVTRPSVLSNARWTPSALNSVLTQHKRQGMALQHALVTAASASSMAFPSPPPTVSTDSNPPFSSCSSLRPISTALTLPPPSSAAWSPTASAAQLARPLSPLRATSSADSHSHSDHKLGAIKEESQESSTEPGGAKPPTGTTSLATHGSIYVGSGLGLRKPEKDYFKEHFSGSAKQTLRKVMDQFHKQYQ